MSPLPFDTTLCNQDLHLQGRPIYIQHLGQINVKKIMELTTDERSLRFHVQEYERCARYIMPACSKAAGRHIEQTFAIIDVKGAPCTGPSLPTSGSAAGSDHKHLQSPAREVWRWTQLLQSLLAHLGAGS